MSAYAYPRYKIRNILIKERKRRRKTYSNYIYSETIYNSMCVYLYLWNGSKHFRFTVLSICVIYNRLCISANPLHIHCGLWTICFTCKSNEGKFLPINRFEFKFIADDISIVITYSCLFSNEQSNFQNVWHKLKQWQA